MNIRSETTDDVRRLVKEMNVSFIQFWFTDVLGMLKSFAITPKEKNTGIVFIDHGHKMAAASENVLK